MEILWKHPGNSYRNYLETILQKSPTFSNLPSSCNALSLLLNHGPLRLVNTAKTSLLVNVVLPCTSQSSNRLFNSVLALAVSCGSVNKLLSTAALLLVGTTPVGSSRDKSIASRSSSERYTGFSS